MRLDGGSRLEWIVAIKDLSSSIRGFDDFIETIDLEYTIVVFRAYKGDCPDSGFGRSRCDSKQK